MLLIKKKRKLGEITGDQIRVDGIPILPRIPIYCDESNEISNFEVEKESYFLNFNIRPNYILHCKKCGFKCELDDEEYYLIRKILRLNTKLEKGKISEDSHSMMIEKYKSKV